MFQNKEKRSNLSQGNGSVFSKLRQRTFLSLKHNKSGRGKKSEIQLDSILLSWPNVHLDCQNSW